MSKFLYQKIQLIFILFFFHSILSFANFQTSNDLISKLAETNDPQVKMKIYAQLSGKMRYKKTKQSIKYIENAIELANKVGTEKEKIKYQRKKVWRYLNTD